MRVRTIAGVSSAVTEEPILSGRLWPQTKAKMGPSGNALTAQCLTYWILSMRSICA